MTVDIEGSSPAFPIFTHDMKMTMDEVNINPEVISMGMTVRDALVISLLSGKAEARNDPDSNIAHIIRVEIIDDAEALADEYLKR